MLGTNISLTLSTYTVTQMKARINEFSDMFNVAVWSLLVSIHNDEWSLFYPELLAEYSTVFQGIWFLLIQGAHSLFIWKANGLNFKDP